MVNHYSMKSKLMLFEIDTLRLICTVICRIANLIKRNLIKKTKNKLAQLFCLARPQSGSRT